MTNSQKFQLYTHPGEMEPLLPSEQKLGALLERAHDLIGRSQRLAGWSPTGALPELRKQLRAMNSYYTNRIEGQHTLPLEIEQALTNNYAQDPDKARRQRLALAHMQAEHALEQQQASWTTQQLWSRQSLSDIHHNLFARLPAHDLPPYVVPGQFRTREVSVGRHAAPAVAHLEVFLSRWSAVYSGARRGEMQVVAIAAAHQRLAWIHPFADGNGRVARLQTHLALAHTGLSNGLWSPLRGMARSHADYYAHLARADQPRAGDLDGRGNLSEAALIAWVSYFIALCTDQVDMMSQLLSLQHMRERIAACLAYEAQVVKQGVRAEALVGLHYLFAAQTELGRADFKRMPGLGDRLATAQVAALLKRGLLVSDTPNGKVRMGFPQHALKFYFPNLWPEAA